MPTDLLDAVKTGGPWAVAFAFTLWLGYKRVWTFTSAADAVTAEKDKRIADLEKQIKEQRDDHRAELAQVRADYAAQVAREVGRSDNAWNSLNPLTEDVHQIALLQEQHGRTLGLLMSGLRAFGASSPPDGPPDPPAPPSPRRRV